MTTITGTHTKEGNYIFHAPTFPYTSTTYIGYTLNEIKSIIRQKYGLQRRHINWIIL